MTLVRLGLTGSIGMGKSTTAAFFAASGIAVWDADAAVHRLYGPGGDAVQPVAALCPAALRGGGIDRAALRDWINADPTAFPRLEAVVHPLVAADRRAFSTRVTEGLAVFDVPLLFENAIDTEMDATLLVTAPAALQRQRVLARPGMSQAQFALILSRQMPDHDKRARATHIVETLSLDQTRAYVQALIAHLRSPHA